MVNALVGTACVAAGVSARVCVNSTGNYTNSRTSLTFLYNNNLNFTDDVNHISAILLDAQTPSTASTACAAVGETLLTRAALQQHADDFASLLSYEIYALRAPEGQYYQIQDGTVSVEQDGSDDGAAALAYGATASANTPLPVLCTQSSNQNGPSNAVATASNKVTISSQGNAYVGFRNQKSFRFLGIKYASPVSRWEYSTVNSAKGQTYQATAYGGACAQPYDSAGVEDCLFINIQTPYIPKYGSKQNLRPVHFWIHGGGFTGGSGADAGSDGGQLSSREDIVVVNVNYRLTTLGFLAVPGTNIMGNYGIADQITGLEWTVQNIAGFGGDPTRIVINGESAGAGSVRTLLGSPKAIGKYRGSIAMSNLGGGVDLGLTGNYATTYSDYLTVGQSYARAGQQIFTAANCTQATVDEQIACLKAVPAQTLVNLATVARYVVQDGVYVDTPNLDVANKVGGAANVNTIWGIVADDGASFSTYPTTPVTTVSQGLQVGLGISAEYADSVLRSGLFPFYDSGNFTLDAFNVTARVATDTQFRCVDQATVYAGVKTGAFKRSYFYQMDRSGSGYNPNNLDDTGPVEPGYPYGNPEEPYFRVHGSDMPWVFVRALSSCSCHAFD